MAWYCKVHSNLLGSFGYFNLEIVCFIKSKWSLLNHQQSHRNPATTIREREKKKQLIGQTSCKITYGVIPNLHYAVQIQVIYRNTFMVKARFYRNIKLKTKYNWLQNSGNYIFFQNFSEWHFWGSIMRLNIQHTKLLGFQSDMPYSWCFIMLLIFWKYQLRHKEMHSSHKLKLGHIPQLWINDSIKR